MKDLLSLPENLPVPEDDGAAAHLTGAALPAVSLVSTEGGVIDVSALGPGRTVIYAYPRTGEPGKPSPDGWDAIPGARGCTPQSCAFRDHHRELAELGARVFGLSTQSTAYQKEMAERLHLPFEVMSDQDFALTEALGLPTFEVEGMRLLKRITLIAKEGRIEKVFYPVFPPDRNADEVIAWLSENRD